MSLVFPIMIVFYFLRIIDYGIELGVSYDLFPLIWNPLYLVNPQATKSQLEWSQFKFYKVSNEKRDCEKEGNKQK